jgi:hypothetical protein
MSKKENRMTKNMKANKRIPSRLWTKDEMQKQMDNMQQMEQKVAKYLSKLSPHVDISCPLFLLLLFHQTEQSLSPGALARSTSWTTAKPVANAPKPANEAPKPANVAPKPATVAPKAAVIPAPKAAVTPAPKVAFTPAPKAAAPAAIRTPTVRLNNTPAPVVPAATNVASTSPVKSPVIPVKPEVIAVSSTQLEHTKGDVDDDWETDPDYVQVCSKVTFLHIENC